jgi:hypothetical protein
MLSVNGWLWIIFCLLLLSTLGFFGIAGVLSLKNYVSYKEQLIYPFTGILGNGSTLTRKDGSNQISCPVGSKVRILGAYFDVYDPYLECAVDAKQGASKSFQKTCQDILNNNAGYSFSCSSNQGMSGCSCDSQGCTVNSGAPRASCECAHTDPSRGFQNCACSNYQGRNPNNCKSRDISAYLAERCDGSNSCPVSLDTSGTDQELVNVLGPYPCDISPINDQDRYALLPLVRANDGLGGVDPSAMRQGYYVHGLFTCE